MDKEVREVCRRLKRVQFFCYLLMAWLVCYSCILVQQLRTSTRTLTGLTRASVITQTNIQMTSMCCTKNLIDVGNYVTSVDENVKGIIP